MLSKLERWKVCFQSRKGEQYGFKVMTNSLPKLIPVESWMGAIQRTQKSWTMLKLKHNSHQTLTQYTSMKGWENLFTLWRRGELWQGVRTKIERRRKRSWVLKLIASILLLIFLQIFMWTLRTLLLYKLIYHRHCSLPADILQLKGNCHMLELSPIKPIQKGLDHMMLIGKRFRCSHCLKSTVHPQIQFLPDRFT